MLSPYVIEEYDGKYWIHKQRKYDFAARKHIKGELAYNKGFDSYKKAQNKVNELIMKTGKLW